MKDLKIEERASCPLGYLAILTAPQYIQGVKKRMEEMRIEHCFSWNASSTSSLLPASSTPFRMNDSFTVPDHEAGVYRRPNLRHSLSTSRSSSSTILQFSSAKGTSTSPHFSSVYRSSLRSLRLACLLVGCFVYLFVDSFLCRLDQPAVTNIILLAPHKIYEIPVSPNFTEPAARFLRSTREEILSNDHTENCHKCLLKNKKLFEQQNFFSQMNIWLVIRITFLFELEQHSMLNSWFKIFFPSRKF